MASHLAEVLRFDLQGLLEGASQGDQMGIAPSPAPRHCGQIRNARSRALGPIRAGILSNAELQVGFLLSLQSWSF